MKVFKKGDEKTIKQAIKLKNDVLKRFIKLYGEPILVHSTPQANIFKKILKQGKIKLPSQHKQVKKAPHIEKFLKIYNCIYYDLSFGYATGYEFKYSLIFDLKYLKELIYYKNPLAWRSCKNIADYLYTNDPKSLKKLANKNKNCKQVVEGYYHKKYKGRTRISFDFWKIEKEMVEFIQNYPDKKKLLSIIKKTEKELLTRFPNSRRHAKKYCLSDTNVEIISKKQMNLKTNPYFLGFYIRGRIPKNIKKILEKDYFGKIIFDGKKIRIIQ